jgi:hypothetical protein
MMPPTPVAAVKPSENAAIPFSKPEAAGLFSV